MSLFSSIYDSHFVLFHANVTKNKYEWSNLTSWLLCEDMNNLTFYIQNILKCVSAKELYHGIHIFLTVFTNAYIIQSFFSSL